MVDVTYEAAREALKASGDEQWVGSRFGDPHDWRRAVLGALSVFAGGLLVTAAILQMFHGWWSLVPAAVLVTGVGSIGAQFRVLARARRVVGGSSDGIPGRYLLAWTWGRNPCVVLFPPAGDVAAWGVVEVADSGGRVPLAGDVLLMCGSELWTGRPQGRSVVVPVLASGPLWPTSPLREVHEAEGLFVGAGGPLLPAPRSAGRGGGGAEGSVAAPDLSASTSSLWSRAGAVLADIWGVLDVEAVFAASGWFGSLLALVVAGSIALSLVVPESLASTSQVAAVVGTFALRAVAQAATGATPGQRARGLRVVGSDSRRPSRVACVLRNTVAAGFLLSVIGVPVLLLPAWLRRDGRGLHDLLAGTRVVRTSETPSRVFGLERLP